ncbi:MarR family winged helix-turn-helix transcriptional regulator [Clostridium chromiireducens]|uniref:MarR family transcriptional regulator n=1 Tax=Clostridium chromiireducens TaxID=225345 RepID=A0A1V4I565_9CLOT|nr:MarR family transcriptional regulator [Clostridium chromiireducens]MVX65378.1 MarR family transcriptional regulator [Clostridium chromiireducens]OPJ55024.1 multiple antibiotic resistance protein MarR [Clostridium chromiireducens]
MNEINGKNFRELIRMLERKLGLLNKQDVCCSEVTLAQCHALVEIGRAKAISLKELANILGLDVSTMSRTVDSLVKKEFIVRAPSKTDRRSVVIELTDKGLTIFNDIENTMDKQFENIFKQISGEDQLTALNGLSIIIDALNKNDNPFICSKNTSTNNCDNLSD